ncbi:hypothetical protein LTR08_000545 [Meristemomyces frigidus]|nr:hypothetical protein LTR08_000545 [Meristemomyces frigidus]
MADDAIQSILDSHCMPHAPATCCCGNAACAYLQHNQSALEGLERDVRTAAKLGQVYRGRMRLMSPVRQCGGMKTQPLSVQAVEGMSPLMFSLQALLMRHESYIADSEKERQAMTAHVGTLETEKQALEKKNATVIGENRTLLDQLEAINSAVAESDTHVTSLQATLESTQLELRRLSRLAARTERLEQQLIDYEREQSALQATLESTEDAEKSGTRRWQKAERTLAGLEDQIERIEREAREEKERHVEVVGRMERRHAVEKELTTAAGRLKGAAASKTAGGTSVVSHFVKDILQDNANLQLGIVELREMLQNSNDEVEGLRTQLFEHQPAAEENEPDKGSAKAKDLRAELTRANSSEVHVHHHYHPPPNASKPPTVRRSKRKRYGVLTPGHFTPPSGFSTPRSSISYGTPSLAATILQQTAVSIPQTVPVQGQRYSRHSSQTQHSVLSSSGPSSPQYMTDRTSSLFDRVFSDAGHESSRPSSPDTEEPGSPLLMQVNAKRTPAMSPRSYSAPFTHHKGASTVGGRSSLDSVLSTSLHHELMIDSYTLGPSAILEENETESQSESIATVEPDSSVTSPFYDESPDPEHGRDCYSRPLRRAGSHDSLLSISGMDIHTVQSRPSQLLARNNGRSFTTQAVISGTTAYAARPAATSRPSASGRSLLNGVAAEQRLRTKPSLGSKVGGWVFGRWGATPAPTAGGARPVCSSISTRKPGSRSSASDKPEDFEDLQATPKKPKARPPGINQCGPIVGFLPEVRTQHPPIMKSLDAAALKGALDDAFD